MLKKEEYAIDVGKVSEYFEVMTTLRGMLSILEKLIGLHFEYSKGSVWQENVLLYTVWDTTSQSSEFFGYLYFDLFARRGKYGGAYRSMIQPGYTSADEICHHSAEALICSFEQKTGQPTLLKMNQVRTMFHELGHCIHSLVGKTKYALPASRDFVEIPSIILENWIWVPAVLKSLGRYYRNTDDESAAHYRENNGDGEVSEERMPDSMIAALIKTKNLNVAHTMLDQLRVALFDLEIHTSAIHVDAQETDTTALWNTMKREIMGLEGCAEMDVSLGQAGFAHIFRK